MSASKTRFFSPALFFIVIGGTAAYIIYSAIEAIGSPSDTMVFFGFPLTLADAVLILLIASIPILFVEYRLFAVPIAALFLFGNRTIKAASYEMNIMNIGRRFTGRHMVRRAAAPALFSVAFSDMLRTYIRPLVFSTAPTPGSFNDAVLSLICALVFMPVALLIFMPTWVLNDSGIVSHLKENRLEIRQCPDTQGVGRWVSGIFGGYALISFPITMFTTHLWIPYLSKDPPIFPQGQGLLNVFLLIAGLPLFVMAFILPVIAFNERSQTRIRVSMAKIASALGATIVRRSKIEKAQRIVREGILTEEAGKVVVSTAKTAPLRIQEEKEVITSRKSTKKKKKNDSKKKNKKK
ncbi:MAG: hypothetical protein ACFFF4_09220 [Candidatus Thorarchaeota archaeon]